MKRRMRIPAATSWERSRSFDPRRGTAPRRRKDAGTSSGGARSSTRGGIEEAAGALEARDFAAAAGRGDGADFGSGIEEVTAEALGAYDQGSAALEADD